MRKIEATEEMLAAAKVIVPTQEEVLAKGYMESGDFMCMGTNEKGFLGQYWDIFVNTCFDGKKMYCRQSALPLDAVDNEVELQVYKESPNLVVKREFTRNGTLENWQETESRENNEEFEKRLNMIPEDKHYLVFTLQDYFNQGTWGWLWAQRCLRFIGVCKVNRLLSEERMTVVWDIVEEKYTF